MEGNCEVASKTLEQLYKVSTPCFDDHQVNLLLKKTFYFLWGFVLYFPNSRHVQHSQQSTPQIHKKSWRSGNLHHSAWVEGHTGGSRSIPTEHPCLPKWREAVGSSQAPRPNKPNTHKSCAQVPLGIGARATNHSTTRSRSAPD